MAGTFCVSLTKSKNDTDGATVAFVMANAAAGSEKETVVFLSLEGVRLAEEGFTDDIHEEGFAPLNELPAVAQARPCECGLVPTAHPSRSRNNRRHESRLQPDAAIVRRPFRKGSTCPRKGQGEF